MEKVVGNENDLVRRGDVLKDIEELDMIDTVDGRGRPVNKEDIRIQMYGTVIYTKKTDAIPVEWIEAEIKKLRDMDNGFASLSAGQIEAMLKKWRESGEADE
jgi:hypothetical protein